VKYMLLNVNIWYTITTPRPEWGKYEKLPHYQISVNGKFTLSTRYL